MPDALLLTLSAELNFFLFLFSLNSPIRFLNQTLNNFELLSSDELEKYPFGVTL